MDNVKMPFLPEETLRIQRVEIYLQDLKDRLKELQLRHREVVESSVEIIKEIDEVSSNLSQDFGNVNDNERMSGIKTLIKEFEKNKETNSNSIPKIVEHKVDIRKILENFEKLNKSHVLTESLVLFRRAKESFEKIDTYLGSHLKSSANNMADFQKLNISENIRNRIYKLNNKELESMPTTSQNVNAAKILEENLEITEAKSAKEKEVNIQPNKDFELKETPSFYASCSSSVVSIQGFQTITDLSKMSASKCSSTLTGYEGDNDDSEYDLSIAKQKKALN